MVKVNSANSILYKPKKEKKRIILLLMALPLMTLVLLFNYVPLFGWMLAFFDYRPGIPLFDNPFVGFQFFRMFLTDTIDTIRVLQNTLIFGFLGIMLSPLPMILAMLINELRSSVHKKFIQTATTLPHFVSWVIVFSIAFNFFATEGLLNQVLFRTELITRPTNILADGSAVYWFQTALSQWKGLGWAAIVYMAAISGIDQELYEASAIDGAGRFRAALHITLPGLLPTYIVLLLLGIGNFLNLGLDQYLLFRNPLTAANIEVIDLFVYRIGLLNQDFSYGVAVGILRSVVSITLLFTANFIAKKIRGTSFF